MDIETLTAILNGNKFMVVGDTNLKYCFQNETIDIVGYGPNKVHYSIYKEDENFFMKTNPPLQTEDFRFDIKENGGFSLSGKHTGKNYLLLRKEMF